MYLSGLVSRRAPRVNRPVSWYLQTALLDGVAGDPDDPHGTQIRLDADDGVLLLAEVGYRRGAEEGRFFRGAIGGWGYTTDFDDVLDVNAEAPRVAEMGPQGCMACWKENSSEKKKAPPRG